MESLWMKCWATRVGISKKILKEKLLTKVVRGINVIAGVDNLFFPPNRAMNNKWIHKSFLDVNWYTTSDTEIFRRIPLALKNI